MLTVFFWKCGSLWSWMEAVIMYWKANNVFISNKWMYWSPQVAGRPHCDITKHVRCLLILNDVVWTNVASVSRWMHAINMQYQYWYCRNYMNGIRGMWFLGVMEVQVWGEITCALVFWRQGLRHVSRNECMGWLKCSGLRKIWADLNLMVQSEERFEIGRVPISNGVVEGTL